MHAKSKREIKVERSENLESGEVRSGIIRQCHSRGSSCILSPSATRRTTTSFEVVLGLCAGRFSDITRVGIYFESKWLQSMHFFHDALTPVNFSHRWLCNEEETARTSGKINELCKPGRAK